MKIHWGKAWKKLNTVLDMEEIFVDDYECFIREFLILDEIMMFPLFKIEIELTYTMCKFTVCSVVVLIQFMYCNMITNVALTSISITSPNISFSCGENNLNPLLAMLKFITRYYIVVHYISRTYVSASCKFVHLLFILL